MKISFKIRKRIVLFILNLGLIMIVLYITNLIEYKTLLFISLLMVFLSTIATYVYFKPNKS